MPATAGAAARGSTTRAGPPWCCFVFETEHAEEVFLRIAARMPGVLLASSTAGSMPSTDRSVRPGGCRLPLHPNAVACTSSEGGDKLAVGRAQDFR